MAKRGKNINVYLMDGEASGRIKCTMANWTGIAYKIPRTRLNDCADREHLKQSGIYFMFGTSDSEESLVYVGQAGARKTGDGLLKRIKETHDMIDWTEVIVFTTTNIHSDRLRFLFWKTGFMSWQKQQIGTRSLTPIVPPKGIRLRKKKVNWKSSSIMPR